jgi:hypothetical protein
VSDAIKGREVLSNVEKFFYDKTNSRFDVITGWRYPDGAAIVPTNEHCYIRKPPIYTIWIARDRVTLPINDDELAKVGISRADLVEAVQHCIWFNGPEKQPTPRVLEKPALKF